MARKETTMKATINGITIETETAEELAKAVNAILGVNVEAKAETKQRIYRPSADTLKNCEQFMSIKDASLATITRQLFDSTPKSERYFKFIFLRGINGKTEVKNLDLNSISDKGIADRIRDSIKEKLDTGRQSSAYLMLQGYGKKTIGAVVKE